MIVALAVVLFGALLFWFGVIRAHWIAPGILFAASAPLVGVFSWSHENERIAAHLMLTVVIFYGAFAVGRWTTHRLIGARRA